jgi:hypothetical protein
LSRRGFEGAARCDCRWVEKVHDLSQARAGGLMKVAQASACDSPVQITD